MSMVVVFMSVSVMSMGMQAACSMQYKRVVVAQQALHT